MIPKEIILDGTAVDMGKGKERYTCYIDGKKILLPMTEFHILVTLVIESDLNGACDTAAFEFGNGHSEVVARYVWRLRKTLHELLPDYGGWPVYENRRDRKYCLHGRPAMNIKLSAGMSKTTDSRIALSATSCLAGNAATPRCKKPSKAAAPKR